MISSLWVQCNGNCHGTSRRKCQIGCWNSEWPKVGWRRGRSVLPWGERKSKRRSGEGGGVWARLNDLRYMVI